MANQAIALQARAPQGNFLAPAIQQGAQFINMMSQQRAAERQAAAQQQQMQLQLAGEERAKAGEARAVAKAALEREADIYVKYRREAPVVAEGGPAAYASYLQRMSVDNPEGAARLSQAMPVDRFDKDTFTRMIMGADEYAAARYGKAIIKEFVTDEGGVMGANISGFPGATYATPIPDISQPRAPMAAPAAPPTAPAAPAPAAGGMFRPAAFSPDQGGADPAAALVTALKNAEQTKQIDAGAVEQIKAMVPPEVVDRFIKVNNIQVSPGSGMQSAVYRPEGGAPMAQQVQYDPNAYAPLRAKSPMQSPTPGTINVPLSRVRDEATARRETPAEAEARAAASMRGGLKPLDVIQREAYATKRGQAQADKDIDFLEKYEGVKDGGLNTLSVIDQMIGDLTVENGRLKAGKRPPHPGFEGVIGATLFPGARFIDGTDAASFDAYFRQVEGKAFLQAFETLKGGGQITEIEGEKATIALSRMKRSTNEVEFVKAAREFSDILRRGLERADKRAAGLLGGGGASAPAAAAGPTLTPRGRSARPPLASFRG